MWAFALFINAALVLALQPGVAGIVLYLSTVGVFCAAFPWLSTRPKWRLEYAGLATLALMFVFAAASLAVIASVRGQTVVHWLKDEIAASVEIAKQVLPGAVLQTDDSGVDLQTKVLREIPSSFLVFSVLLIWANVTILIRYNVMKFRDRLSLPKDYLSRFKVPEWWVWPALVSGFLGFFVPGALGQLGQIGVTLSLLLYSMQGVSVFAFVLDRFKIGGFWRTLLVVAVVFLALPVVPAAGFFDLWFDFRSKLRH